MSSMTADEIVILKLLSSKTKHLLSAEPLWFPTLVALVPSTTTCGLGLADVADSEQSCITKITNQDHRERHGRE